MQITSNTRPFIESEIVSSFILMNLHDGLLGTQFYRNVADFQNGDTLLVKTVGSVTLQEISENTPPVYNPIETGEIQLTITEEVGDAWYITDNLREDGHQIESLLQARATESTRAMQERFESHFFDVAGAHYETGAGGAGAGSPGNINSQPHLIPSTATNNVFELDQLVQCRLAFNKANVPQAGRVVFVDPVCAATLDTLVTITHDVTEFGKNILQGGMSSSQRFVMNLYGFDIIESNRLKLGSYSDGTTTIATGVGNLAMCVLDDQCKPVMAAWRRMPKSEGERNKDKRRDEHTTSARWGMGIQRLDTLACLPTHATLYK